MNKVERDMKVQARVLAAFFIAAIPLVLLMLFTPMEYNIWHNHEAYPGWNQYFWLAGAVFSIIVAIVTKMEMDGWVLLGAIIFGPVYGLMILIALKLLKVFPVKEQSSGS